MSEYHEIQDLYLDGWGAKSEAISKHLEFITDVDLSEPDYSFHLLRVYVRRSDGMILWSTDSGCSCPAPFEDTAVKDLRESSSAAFVDAAMRWVDENEYASNPTAEIRRDLVAALAAAQAAGAR